MLLKRMKMTEKELTRVEGQSVVLEQQKMMVQSSTYDSSVMSGMKACTESLESMNKQMNVDNIADLQDDLEDLTEIEDRQ